MLCISCTRLSPRDAALACGMRYKFMRIVMMACTERGFSLMERTAKALALCLPGAEILQEGRCARVPGYENGPRLSQSTEKWFTRADALVFFSAAGIAVRCIAPFVKDKFADPAVIVIDEGGNFCISLLSGHVGGANRLCRIIARESGAIPVITTATDTQGRFSVDEFAVENGLHIDSREAAKRISAAVAAGERVKIYTDPVSGVLLNYRAGEFVRSFSGEGDSGKASVKEGFSSADDWGKASVKEGFSKEELSGADTAAENGGAFIITEGTGAVITSERNRADIIISFRKMPQDLPDALYLIPRLVTLGIGCRKGTKSEEIRETAEKLLRKNGIFREALCGVASIDLKKEEAGLIEFSEQWNLTPVFYTAGELEAVPGKFCESEFVRETTGAGNVCERSAVRLAMEKRLQIKGTMRPESADRHEMYSAFCPVNASAVEEQQVRLLAGKMSRNGVTAALACLTRAGK